MSLNFNWTYLEGGTTTWPPRSNTYDSGHSWRAPVRSLPISTRQRRWLADSAVSRPGAERDACDNMIGLAATETGTTAHFCGLTRLGVVPCTERGPCSAKLKNQLVCPPISPSHVLQILTTYSKTKVSVSLVWTMSCSVTIFACFNSLSRDASRIAVNGAPSSSCSLISFNATTWWVKLRFTEGNTEIQNSVKCQGRSFTHLLYPLKTVA